MLDVLQAVCVTIEPVPDGTVRQAVGTLKIGIARPLGSANVALHVGIGEGAERAQAQKQQEDEIWV